MVERMGVIGKKDQVLAFQAVGVEVFTARDAQEAKELIKQLSKENFAVLFLAEELAQQMGDTLAKAKARPYPAIIPIPTGNAGSGFGMMGIKKDVEKALGVDILFNK